MMNKFKNVLDWKQKTKLFGFIRSAHAENTSANLAYAAMEPIRDYEMRAEQEKAKASAFFLRRTAIL